jgi:outer membrane protein TolC
MRLKSKTLGLVLAFSGSIPALLAQDSTQLRQLDQDAYLKIIQSYHPVIRAADIDVLNARANLMRARGVFDPQAKANYHSKNLDGKEYYTYFSPGITIPTWYGLEFKAGVDDARGYYLNPETTPGAVSYVGAKLVATNIFFDVRRAGVEQARVLVRQSEADRLLAVNDLYYQSISAYWNWWLSWEQRRVWREAQAVADERLQFVRQEYLAGARAAIDTTEALTQIQSLEAQFLTSDLTLQNAGVTLNTYLWYQNNTLVPWEESWLPARPQLRPIPPLTFFLEQLPDHPKLQSARAKIEFLNIDLRMKNQYLFPKISIGGSVLGKDWNPLPNESSGTYLRNNYKLEADLSIPLFLREARGNLQMARLKTQQATLAQDIAYIDLEAKVRGYYNEAINLSQQQMLWEQSFAAYERLLQGEIIRFENGESTLFLINARQSKLLEASQKLLDIYAKRGKAEAGLYWAAGLLIQ